MRNLLLIIAFLIFPILLPVNVCAGYEFPKGISEYIKKKNLSYKPPTGSFDKNMIAFFKGKKFNNEPWSVQADLNGNRKTDFAGLMRAPTGNLDLVAVYSTDMGLAHKVLYANVSADNNDINVAIFLEPPGRVQGFPFEDAAEKDTFAYLKYPGVHLIFFEQSAILFYWKGAEFKSIWTAD